MHKDRRPSFLKRWAKLPDSHTHRLLVLVLLVVIILSLIKWAS